MSQTLLGKGDVIIRVITMLKCGGRGRDHKTTVDETVLDGGWSDLVPGGLNSIDGIKNCPVDIPASLQQSML